MTEYSAYSVKMRKWVRDQAMALEGTKAVRHIFPRAYCVAKPAPLCGIFVTPWMDAEPPVRDKEAGGAEVVYKGVEDVGVGDWCALAYVIRDGCMATVAFPLPEE